MTFLVSDLLEIIAGLAPLALAAEWDNVGLQVGGRSGEASPVLVTLNVTDEVLEEAAARGCRAILTHHPLIFAPLASVSADGATGALIDRAIKDGIAVVAVHTNLDSAPGGLADILAGMLELQNITPVEAAATGWSKLVTFMPAGDADAVKEAVFAAGAGIIGDYEHCSWSVSGQGSFLPREGAHPSIGEVGRDERVEELRLETVFPAEKESAVIAALMAAHSYEEPAYDIYPLASRRRDAGVGRVGDLGAPATLAELAARAAALFAPAPVRFAGDSGKTINRVAVVPGSGGDLMSAAGAQGADALVTGDIRYHQALAAGASGPALIDVPHDASEALALKHWLPRLNEVLAGKGGRAILSEAATNPWNGEEAPGAVRIESREESHMHSLYVDGGARGNPGPAGIGAVLLDEDGHKIDELASFIGEATNNIAEYRAMIAGLEMAIGLGLSRLNIFSDSELIVRQLQGAYKVKNEGLKPYFRQAQELLGRLEGYELHSIPRERNAEADRLVNAALDSAAR